MHGSEGQQSCAGTDIGMVAGDHAFALHQVEHGEAARGGLVLPGAEGLAGGNGEIHHPCIGGMIRRADMEAARADRLDAFLAFGHPVGFGHLLDRQGWCIAIEQGGDASELSLLRLMFQIDLDRPFFRAIICHFHAGDDPFRRPVDRVFVRDQCRPGDILGNFRNDLPAISHPHVPC